MSLFRPNIARISGYVPGEQPQESGWVKLNTNENPYPPSPQVTAAIDRAARGPLNKYPDPLSTELRRVVGQLFDRDPEWILPANGSDENLTLLMRTFVDPGELVAFPYPSYVLYETLADIQGATHRRLVLNPDWSWDFERIAPIIEQSKLVFVPNPNSPSGNRWSQDEILRLVPPRGLLVLDEAYGDFADEPHRGEIFDSPAGERIVITRTLSKSYSLAGIRLGFAIAHPDLIAGMCKVKDSYNCDSLSLAAAAAAIADQEWMLANTAKIRATRDRLGQALQKLGFHVAVSQANFVWTTHPTRSHQEIFQELKRQKILVRLMSFPSDDVDPSPPVDGLRITIGTDDEIDILLNALKQIG